MKFLSANAISGKNTPWEIQKLSGGFTKNHKEKDFKVLVYAVAGNKKKRWREKWNEVIGFFSNLPNYNADEKAEQIQDALVLY